MNTKKVLFIMTCSYPPSEGVGSYVLNIAKKIPANIDITIVTKDTNSKKLKEYIDGNIKIYKVPISKVPFFGLFSYSRKIEKLFIGEKFDLVQYHSPLVFFIKKIQSNYNMAIFHSTMKESVKHFGHRGLGAKLKYVMGQYLSPFAENSLIQNCQKIVCVSQSTLKEFSEAYNVSTKDFLFIPNCIDDSIFKDAHKSRNKIICHIGRIDYGKGIIELLKSVENIKDEIQKSGFSFVFIGSGRLDVEFLGAVKKLNLGGLVKKIDYMPQDELSDFLNEIAYCIINSKYETGPRVALESMSTATPVISTMVGLLNNARAVNYYIPITSSVEESILHAINAFGTDDYIELQNKASEFAKDYHCSRSKLNVPDIMLEAINE